MRKISLQEAYNILEDCSGIFAEDSLISPELSALVGSPENEFMRISWLNEDENECSTKFTEGDNQTVIVVGASMFLTDHEGDDIQITILQEKPLEKI